MLYNFYEKAFFMCTLVHIGILGQVWDLIVSIPDLCTLTYIVSMQLSILHFKVLQCMGGSRKFHRFFFVFVFLYI